MGAALNMAAATNAYVLSDRATWIHFGNKGDLQIVVQGDRRLFNQYGVLLVNPEKHPNVKKALGQQFIDYLISPEGQRDITNYKIDGQQLFYPNAGEPGARLEQPRRHFADHLGRGTAYCTPPAGLMKDPGACSKTLRAAAGGHPDEEAVARGAARCTSQRSQPRHISWTRE
jgi:hypothetical protein